MAGNSAKKIPSHSAQNRWGSVKSSHILELPPLSIISNKNVVYIIYNMNRDISMKMLLRKRLSAKCKYIIN